MPSLIRICSVGDSREEVENVRSFTRPGELKMGIVYFCMNIIKIQGIGSEAFQMWHLYGCLLHIH